MLPSIAAVVLIAATQVGTIHVFVEAGFEVYLDSKPIGTSIQSEGGLQIREVPAGEHEVTVKTPWGNSVSAKVSVFAGNTAGVSISSLGLRGRARADNSTVEVQVRTPSATCELAVGGERITSASDEMQIEHLKPGQYRVLLTCGSRSASMTLALPAGRILTLHADLATGRMTVIGDRPRITAVRVPTAEDSIMRLPIPMKMKRAFAGSLVAGVKAKRISQMNDTNADAIYLAADWSAGNEVVSRLRERDEVDEVPVNDYRHTREGVEFHVRVTFRP